MSKVPGSLTSMSAARVVSSESLLVPPLAVALPEAAQRLGQTQQHITLTGGQMAARDLSDIVAFDT